MKEKDFEDIGKRLYDLEADPPKGGWRKIGTALRSPQSGGKQAWLRKHWWKPLIIIVPALMYVWYTNSNEPVSTTMQHVSDSVTAAAQSSGQADSAEESALNQSDSTASGEATDSQSNRGNDLKSREESNVQASTLSKTTDSRVSTAKIEGATTKPGEAARSGTQRQEKGDGPVKSIAAAPSLTKSQTEKGQDQGAVQNIKGTDRLSSPDSLNESRAGAIVLAPATKDEQVAVTHTEVLGPQKDEALAFDSVEKVLPEELVTVKKDSFAQKVPEEKEKKEKQPGGWRLSVSLGPQFTAKSVTPDAGDEVLVTSVDWSDAPTRIGLGFSLGASRVINQNLQIDARLSWMSLKQNFGYSYTDGLVDTLLATLQPDQSVLVTPVYQTYNREIESTYNYGGLHLGATYYFWSTRRRRVNLTASAGMHYLLSANVKEQIDGEWVTLGNEGLNRMNYSLSFGAGYCVMLSHSFELSISPTLTYFLLEAKNSELPYHLNQHSLGINFMLSKSIGN